jgi:hypothetical protein
MADFGGTIGHLDDDQRAVLRPVALAYLWACKRRLDEHQCFRAALEEYFRLRPDADKEAARRRVPEIIAAAINANPQWFWHGPDV